MFTKSLAVMLIMCGSACLGAESLVIGSVAAQGELRIDGYLVKGSGTVLDGSVIETGPHSWATATVRLENGTEIRFYHDSRGVVHRNQLLLLHGKAELSAPQTFRAHVPGLTIGASESRVQESIDIQSEGRISILSQSGRLNVAEDGGGVLAQVNPQRSMAFSRGTDARWRVTSANERDSSRDRDHHDGRDDDRDHHDRDDDGDDDRHHHHKHPSR